MKPKLTWLLIIALLLTAATCPKPQPEKVWVKVCNSFPDTPGSVARLATEWCKEVHYGQYLKGQEPTIYCDLHHAPPPIPVTVYPWPETHRLLIWEGTLICFLSTKVNDEFTERGIIDYADALAQDGVNCIRSFSFFLDETPGYWESWKPADAEYRDVVQARLKLMADRKITVIVSLEPYGGMATDSELEWIIETAKPYLPYVIFETANESGDMVLQNNLISRLHGHEIPDSAIQLYFVDSSDFANALINFLSGQGLACLHGVGSMETINQPGTGWATSPGCMKLMTYGLFPSSDGEDATHSAQGDYWHWLQNGPGRRPSVNQIYQITLWSLRNGRGYECLSAKGFLNGDRPNLKAAIELGHEERLAMAKAYQEVVK